MSLVRSKSVFSSVTVRNFTSLSNHLRTTRQPLSAYLRSAFLSPSSSHKQYINPLWTGSAQLHNTADEKTPGQGEQERHRDAEKEPLPEWPDGVNPHTGEKGGPKGPEPTRYGDWERKGRVTDF